MLFKVKFIKKIPVLGYNFFMRDEILIFLIVIGLIFISYITYVIISFVFMGAFLKKLDVQNKTLNILLYQKVSALFKIIEIINKYINLDNYLDKSIINYSKLNISSNDVKALLEITSNQDYLKYQEYKDTSLLVSFFTSLDKYFFIINELLKVIKISNKEDLQNINLNLSFNDDISSRFIVTTQLFNSNVVGYNYWRNLKFTKFIKRMFKVAEKKQIL